MLSPPSFHSLSQTASNLSNNYVMNNLDSTRSKYNIQSWSVTFITMTTRSFICKRLHSKTENREIINLFSIVLIVLFFEDLLGLLRFSV